MFFWFLAAAVLVVLFVFDSPMIDYRWVAFGGVLPLIETVSGRPLVLHTLLGSVGLMTLVMAATIGQRLRRRRWLGIPIGTFVFLVVSGAWARTELFWWPVAGFDGIASRPIPEFDRPVGVLVVLELVGIGSLVWIGLRLGLDDAGARRDFASTGRVPKERLR